MVSDAEMHEEIDAGLAHAAHLLLAAADRVHTRIQACEDAGELAGHVKSLEGATRALRLTYNLRVKLRRDAKRGEREDEAQEAKRNRQQIAFRRDQVRTAVQALWREADWEADPDLDIDLFGILMEESDAETFLTEDLGDLAARVLRRLGYEFGPDGLRPIAAPASQAGAPAPAFDSSA